MKEICVLLLSFVSMNAWGFQGSNGIGKRVAGIGQDSQEQWVNQCWDQVQDELNFMSNVVQKVDQEKIAALLVRALVVSKVSNETPIDEIKAALREAGKKIFNKDHVCSDYVDPNWDRGTVLVKCEGPWQLAPELNEINDHRGHSIESFRVYLASNQEIRVYAEKLYVVNNKAQRKVSKFAVEAAERSVEGKVLRRQNGRTALGEMRIRDGYGGGFYTTGVESLTTPKFEKKSLLSERLRDGRVLDSLKSVGRGMICQPRQPGLG